MYRKYMLGRTKLKLPPYHFIKKTIIAKKCNLHDLKY